jgi:tetratricopeptide (TPR) repeat protein
MALGDAASAKTNFAEALQLEPEGWVPRPETGYALAELLRREGRPADAVSVLETLVAAVPGTTIAAQARLDVGGIWEAGNEVAQAARSYAQLLDEGAPSPQSREAILRLGLLGVDHADRMELTEPYPAYRVFYRPRPTLERYAAERDPRAAQRAMRGLARLARSDGDVIGALATLARVFQEYPESPESGQAYESFMDLLESHLAERLGAGAYAEVVEVYQGLKGPMGWVPTRDTGSLAARAAEAYEALGAPASARRVYQGLLAAGTRAIENDELTTRVERTRLRGGHLEALRRWVERNPDDRDARSALARTLAREGETSEARQHFLAVARQAPSAEEKLRALVEADRLLPGSATVGELIAAMEARQELADSLPPGPERDAWKTQDRLIEARLRFASAEYEVAAGLFREIPELGPADTYLLALAESRAGQRSRAADVFADLVESPDALFAGLAALHVELAELNRATGSRL